VLASAVGLALGLLLMALAPRPAVGRAMLLPTMLLFWLLGGEYRAVPELPPGVRPFATLTPSRWEFEGLILLEARAVPDPPGGDDLAEAFFPAETDRMGTTADALALGLMLIGLAAPTGFIAAKVLPVSKGLRASPAAPGRGDGP
jgi:hypothetical protein